MGEERVSPFTIESTATADQRAALLAFECVAAEFDGRQIQAAMKVAQRGPEAVGDVVTLIADVEQRQRTEALLAACGDVFSSNAFMAVTDYEEKIQWAIELDREFGEYRAASTTVSPLIADKPDKIAAHKERYRREMARRSFEIYAGRLVRQQVEVKPVPTEQPEDAAFEDTA